jgi:PAS domain S-box-containing protein
VAATLESSGPHSAAFITPHTYGRPAQLLVVALRDIAVLIGKQLAGEGLGPKWRLHIAHTVTSAWQRMSETNFDLVLVDLSIEEVRTHVGDIVASAGATLVYGLCDDERGEIAMSARRAGIADVLSTQHLRGPSTLRLMRLLLESARTASNSRLLAAAVEGAPVAYAMTDALQPDMPLVYVNEHFIALTGYQPSEVIGRNCRFLQGPQTDSRDVDRIREAIRRAQPLYIELLNYRKDGQPFWNGVLLRPIRTASGTVTHFVATLRDMSERRHTEEALERSARLHRLLVEASGGMTVFAGPDGQLRAPLPEFETFTGLRYEDYRSGDWSAVIHPDDRRKFIESRSAAINTPKECTCVFRLWHAASGSWRHAEMRMLPLFDTHDRVTEWIGTLTDVDERLANEQAQLQSNEFLTGALDALPQSMLYADRDGIVRWMNRACCAWLGVAPGELIGQPLLKLADATDRELLPRRIEAVLAGKAQRYSELVTLRNRSATLDVAFVPYQASTGQPTNQAQPGRIEGFFWIGTDPVAQEQLSETTRRWRLSGLGASGSQSMDRPID